ncbi:hypothetical protein ACQ4M3_03470 [Leptolyngbya sp. AN03gr2]|uniref:hypothetical protein n=1 Tax=unclassified Leptolyngbya TaxID=2650499 RepID=UPI003D319638
MSDLPMPEWITLEEAIGAHEAVIQQFGGAPGIRDPAAGLGTRSTPSDLCRGIVASHCIRSSRRLPIPRGLDKYLVFLSSLFDHKKAQQHLTHADWIVPSRPV